MPKGQKTSSYIHRHADGTIWGKGRMRAGKMHGAWTWFRKDGTAMRSGNFSNGKQIGEWITYDHKGRVVKVTQFQDAAKKKAVDAYLARLSPPVRSRMEALRRAIKRSAPGAEESISYAIPAFKLRGKLVWYAAFKNHYSLFAPTVRTAFARYMDSKSAIHFPYDKPLPTSLVTRIVKAAVQKNLNAR